MHTVCYLYFEPFLCKKCFFQVKIKFLGQTPTILRKIQINLESFVIVRNKKFHVEIRVFLMTCLLDLVSKIFFNWDSLHGRLNSHYEAWSYNKKTLKKIKAYGKSV